MVKTPKRFDKRFDNWANFIVSRDIFDNKSSNSKKTKKRATLDILQEDKIAIRLPFCRL